MEKNEEKKSEKGISALKGSCLWGILLFLVLILVDQITKAAADVYFNTDGAPKYLTVVPGWVYLTITYNRGISYGMGSNAPMEVKIAIVVATALMMIGIAIAYFKVDKRRSMIRLAFVLIVAGGVGNLIDRVYYRVWDPATEAVIRDGVRDMVDISSIGFAVCNFADFFISAGAVALVLACLFFDSYAYAPQGKYKELAEEAEEKDKAKAKAKKAKKLAKEMAKEFSDGNACSAAVIGEIDSEEEKKAE